MNRILLIGNGFDLAHGLKTSYSDFIDNFWDRQKNKVIASYEKQDAEYAFKFKDDVIRLHSNNFKNKSLLRTQEGYNWFACFTSLKKDSDFDAPSYSGENRILVKNSFLETISKKKSIQNWVDVEVEYYIKLNECLQDKTGEGIKQLNDEFSKIKAALEKYLETQTEITVTKSPKIEQKIHNFIPGDPTDRKHARYNPEDFLYLNFNYTGTEKLYANPADKVIHIHGELNNPKNPIIFGYGDEIDEKYKLIEQENDNRYLENIKSIKYSETGNYRKMLDFIGSDAYEVFVMGHSCGMSDRTLLHTLFEHDNCLSIKVFYNKREDGTDNHSDVVMNISRNFTRKSLMRERIVAKEDSEPLS